MNAFVVLLRGRRISPVRPSSSEVSASLMLVVGVALGSELALVPRSRQRVASGDEVGDNGRLGTREIIGSIRR